MAEVTALAEMVSEVARTESRRQVMGPCWCRRLTADRKR